MKFTLLKTEMSSTVLIDKYDFDVILADCDVADAHLTKSFFDWLIEHRPALSQRVIRMYTPGSRNDAFDEKATRACVEKAAG